MKKKKKEGKKEMPSFNGDAACRRTSRGRGGGRHPTAAKVARQEEDRRKGSQNDVPSNGGIQAAAQNTVGSGQRIEKWRQRQ